MEKFTIKDIYSGFTAFDVDSRTINVEMELQNSYGESLFLSIVEFEGFSYIFKTDNSILIDPVFYEDESEDAAHELSDDEEDGEVVGEDDAFAMSEWLLEYYCEYCEEDYTKFYDNKKCCGIFHDAVRLLIYFIRLDWDDFKRNIQAFIGKRLDEIEIPKCDAEEAWEKGVGIEEL